MKRMQCRWVWLALLAGCTHSSPFPTGPIDPLGPITENNNQLTFNPWDDYAPSWTPDGRSVIYTYSDQAKALGTDSRCIGIVPAMGGTRTFTLCDTRSTHADSSDMFSAVALRPDGEMLFLQGVGTRKTTSSPRTMVLWLADTAAPLAARRALATFPRPIGDSVIDYLTDAAWVDSNTFMALGHRLTYPADPQRTSWKDTLPRPLYMVRGVMAGSAVALSQIPGTEFAAHWSRTPAGDILFVRGALDVQGLNVVEEPTIMRVSATGGVPDVFATAPNGQPVRGLTCQAGSCLVLTTSLYRLDPTSRGFTLVNLGPALNFATWKSPALSPNGSTVVYRATTTVFNTLCLCSRAVGNLFRALLPAP